jgi:saposin
MGFCNSRRSTIPLIRIGPVRSLGGRPRVQEDSTPNTPQLNNFFFTLPRLQTRDGINAGCLVCQAAFTTVLDLLKQEQVASSVAAEMTNFVCAMVPGTMKTGCGDFMRIYSRAIIQMIASQYNPSQICSAMRVCKPEDERKIAQLSPTVKSEAVCEACQILSQYLSFEFQQPGFQQEVIDALKGGCTYLPGDYKLQCEDSLRSYVPSTLGFLADYIGRDIVCVTFKMCPGPQATTPEWVPL